MTLLPRENIELDKTGQKGHFRTKKDKKVISGQNWTKGYIWVHLYPKWTHTIDKQCITNIHLDII